MKKITGFVVVVITLVSVLVYLENSKKSNSYSTPEVALNNVENPKLEILEIIDTKFYEKVAYVFYYSKVGETPKSYLAVGVMNKNTYGWRLDDITGIGSIDKNNIGMTSGKEKYIVGFASKKVERVMFGNQIAKMVTMDKENLNAFLFHDVELNLMTQTDMNYFDKEGFELQY